jgi:hypothetical protein
MNKHQWARMPVNESCQGGGMGETTAEARVGTVVEDVTFAHYFDNHGFANPQPESNERDCYGHFRGCARHGCAATRCRELWSKESSKNWYWTTIAHAANERVLSDPNARRTIADAVAIERAEIAECDRQIHEMVTTLHALLSIQSRSACSPEERVAYDKAKALLVEHGVGGVPEEMQRAYVEWEARNAR